MTDTNPTGPSAIWHAALGEGRLLLQRDPAGGVIHPPRPLGVEGVEWVEASGEGTVYSLTTIHPKPPAAPYHVALVDLAEGARVTARVEGQGVAIGDAVRARIVREDDRALLVFDPA
jgi:uncharacterized OB-fold protein